MSEVIVVVVGALATTISSITIWGVKELRVSKDRQSDRIDTLENLQLAVTRMVLLQIYKDIMERGTITVQELQVWDQIYRSYHDLGGNGIVDVINEDIRDLKIKG